MREIKKPEEGRIKAAVSVYMKEYKKVTPKELEALGFEGIPSMEYLREAVVETLAEYLIYLMAEDRK